MKFHCYADETQLFALVTSHLDHCNELFFGWPDKSIHKLQQVQHSAAHMTFIYQSHHIRPAVVFMGSLLNSLPSLKSFSSHVSPWTTLPFCIAPICSTSTHQRAHSGSLPPSSSQSQLLLCPKSITSSNHHSKHTFSNRHSVFNLFILPSFILCTLLQFYLFYLLFVSDCAH